MFLSKQIPNLLHCNYLINFNYDYNQDLYQNKKQKIVREQNNYQTNCHEYMRKEVKLV